jgi:peptidoglycan/LPS O-acetylase OafA/YrhL
MAESSSLKPLDYRPDLDGMRAVAVIPVILFHLQVPLFPGGFVGVDVFFVLSGFLITRMLVADLESGNFSLWRFYDRRIRRILPALFVMLAFCSIAAVIILFPPELKKFSSTLFAAAVSLSNFYFAAQVDYFAPTSEFMPLLHTWSLAVEEQFYLVFPLVLWAAWRWPRPLFCTAIWFLFFASLAASAWGISSDDESEFFLSIPRAWELLTGSLLALGFMSRPAYAWQREVASIAGVAAILAAMLFYSAETPLPGVAALIPCLGTALVIWSGLGTQGAGSRMAALLGTGLPVFIGLISYSLYLWHWPLIVFARHLSLEGLTLKITLLVLLLTLILSIASWHFVEKPMRAGKWPWPTPRHRFAATATVVLVFCVLASGLRVTANSLPGSPKIEKLLQAEDDRSSRQCFVRSERIEKVQFSELCILGEETSRTVTIFGDSHGNELAYAIGEEGKQHGASVRHITASSCPPFSKPVTNVRPRCIAFINRMVEELSKREPSTIILVGNFMDKRYRVAHDAASAQPELLWRALEKTARRLRNAGHTVIMLGAVPPHPHGFQLPSALARWVRLGGEPENYRYALDRTAALRIDETLSKIAEVSGAKYVRLTPYFCPSESGCIAYRDHTVMFYDDDHLSKSGARKVVAEVLAPVIWPAAPAGLNQ